MRWLCFLIVVEICHAGYFDWDLLIFTQHWPSTVCLDYEEHSPNNFCEKPKAENRWTIHGVWPTKLHSLGPGFCNASLVFDPNKIAEIRSDLITAWPNIEGGKSEDSLWEHEWSKHGTCAVELPELDSEMKYFKKGLDWFAKYEMTNLLGRAGITPSDTYGYKVENIHYALRNILGVNPRIQCIFEKDTYTPYLFEIRICFDKSLRPVGCDGTELTDEMLTNCPKCKDIQYPQRFSNVGFDPTSAQEQWVRRFAKTIRKAVQFVMLLDWLA